MRFNYSSAGHAVWRTVLALMLLTSPGCTQIVQPSEGATPPAQQPAYAALAAKYFSETMADRASFENFEISELRWVHGLKGSFADLCAVPTERCRDRRALRRSTGFMRIAILHAVRRGHGRARPADCARPAAAVLVLRSRQAGRQSVRERRAPLPA